MSLARLGLRYERLLIFAAPLTLASLFVLFIAVALDGQRERAQTRCYAEAADLVEGAKVSLEDEWARQTTRIVTQQGADLGYFNRVIRILIFGLHAGGACYDLVVKDATDSQLFMAPDTLIESYRKKAQIPVNSPIKYYGIEVPDKATIAVAGTYVQVDMVTLTQALQIALGPLLLLWLGSLYNTRYRETQLIGTANRITDVFPHLINIYPVGKQRSIRRKNWTRFYFRYLISAAAFFVRAGLICVFVVPPVFAFILSMYFLHLNQHIAAFVGLGILVGSFTFMNVFGEALIWHVGKIFPGPYEFG